MDNSIIIKDKIKNYNKIIKVSSDKSISIRTILLASQAVGISRISNLLESEDVLNAIKSIKKLGIKCNKVNNIYYIHGFGLNGFIERKSVETANSIEFELSSFVDFENKNLPNSLSKFLFSFLTSKFFLEEYA